MIITTQNVTQSFQQLTMATQPLDRARALLSRPDLPNTQQMTNAELRAVLAVTVEALQNVAGAYATFLLQLQPDHSRHRR